MVQRCSNGVAFVVLEPEPSIRTGIRVEIYDGANPNTLLDVLSDTWGRQWTDPLRGPGSGRFSIYALDPKLAANPDLLAYGNIARFVLDGVDRFAITIEKRTLTQLGAGDDAARVLTVEGRGVLAKLEESVVYPAGGLSGDTARFEDPATAGDVMRSALLEAQARNAAHAITPPSATVDANNAPYDVELELSERAGTDLLRVAERHAELAVDVAMTVDLQLLYYNARGVDRTVQTANVGPVELRPGRNLVALERDETGTIRNALLVETPTGYLERIEAASVATHRRREAFLSLGNTTSSDQVDLSAAAVFRRSADPAAEIGAEVLDVDGARPYVDWGIGDWVLAPDETGALTRYRVRALTVAETAEGRPTFVPELATITEELDARLERWLKAMARGTLSGEAGAVAEPNQAPPEVVEAIAADIDEHTATQPHVDELSDLADVDVTGLADGDGLRYDAGAGAWVPASTLDELAADVNAPSPADGQVLEWDAGTSEWRPATPSGGGGGGGGGVEELASDNHADRGTPDVGREFTDGEADDWTLVEDASPNITVTKSLGRLSILHPGGDAGAEMHALVWPFAPAGDFYIETAARWAGFYANYLMLGLVAADGDTYGAGEQIFPRIRLDLNDLTTSRMANWNSSPTNLGSLTAPRIVSPLTYLRLVRSSGAWQAWLSPDGISWIAAHAAAAYALTVSHVGVAVSTWGASRQGIFAFEYFAAYNGTP